MKKIAVLGIACVDIYAKGIQKIPNPGELSHINSVVLSTGGCALNVGINLAKMGLESKLLIPIGNDYLGNYILDEVKHYGIDSSYIHIDENTSSSSSIVLVNESGERSFLHYPGTNATYRFEDIPLEVFDDVDILFISGALALKSLDGLPLAKLLKYAKSKGIYTVVDTVFDPTNQWHELIKDCFQYTDLFAPSYDEANYISNIDSYVDMVEFFKEKGVKDVLIKLGSVGVYSEFENKPLFVSSVENKNVIDTTGAGDAFMSGVIVGLAKNWPIKQTLEYANMVGSICISSVGASTGIIDFETIERMRSEYYEKN